jgi:uncharacterized membrane protein
MDIFKSKKFWMAVVGVVAIVLAKYLPISEDQVLGIAGVIISYIFGQGLADAGKEAKKIEGK